MASEASGWRGWREATEWALYGPRGFFRRPEGPAGHFRTSVHASPQYAAAVAELLRRVDEALGHPPELALVDVGSGRGELLTGVLAVLDRERGAGGASGDRMLPGSGAGDVHSPGPRATGPGDPPPPERVTGPGDPDASAGAPGYPPGTAGAGGTAAPGGTVAPGTATDPDTAAPDAATDPDAAAPGAAADVPAGPLVDRLRPYAVERAARPDGLDPRIAWVDTPPADVRGLLFANEWLDNVPVDIAETGPDGVPRRVLVAPDGIERLGGPVGGADARWLDRWWPLPAEPGARAEIGLPRDLAWADAVRGLRAGLAVAVDYAHERAARPPFGTLTGYREGREVRPVPDGSCDLTSHVALDACAATGHAALSAAAPARTGADPAAPADTGADPAAPGTHVRPATPARTGTGPTPPADTGTGPATPGPHVRPATPARTGTGPTPPADTGTGPAGTSGARPADRSAAAAPETAPRLVSQRDALRALGVHGRRPPLALASTDPAGYLRALSAAGAAAELTDPAGLGGFRWLLQPVGPRCRDVLPAVLAGPA